MEDYGPRTEALVSFCHDLEQSFLLAGLISRGGKSEVTQLRQEAQELQQSSDITDMAKASHLHKELIRFMKLAQETTPNVLFLFLMTKFEAYIEDLAVLICQDSPQLIGIETENTEEEIRKNINILFFQKRLDQIADIFNKQLKIPFADTCNSAQKCTPRELDKAKAIRNIHIHNRGRVNQRFKNRIGNQSLKDGETYLITMDYLNDLKDKVFCIVWGLDIFATIIYPNIPISQDRARIFLHTTILSKPSCVGSKC